MDFWNSPTGEAGDSKHRALHHSHAAKLRSAPALFPSRFRLFLTFYFPAQYGGPKCVSCLNSIFNGSIVYIKPRP